MPSRSENLKRSSPRFSLTVTTPLSADTLLAQGACCGNGCQNCPFLDEHGAKHHKGSLLIAPKWQKWILFDFDGTLADSLPLQIEAYSEIARRHNWPPFNDAEFRQLRSMSLRQAIRTRGIPLWKVPGLLRAGQAFLNDRWGEVDVFDGIPELLDELSQSGFHLGIVTSNTPQAVETILKQAGVRQYFSIVVAEPHLWGKARQFKRLMHKHGWSADRIWYVGDEVRDLEATQAAGIQGIGVTWGLNDAEILAKTGAPIVDTPQNLVHWIQTHQPN